MDETQRRAAGFVSRRHHVVIISNIIYISFLHLITESLKERSEVRVELKTSSLRTHAFVGEEHSDRKSLTGL